MSLRKIKVGLSGINATDNPGAGLGLARSLIESDYAVEIIGISYDPHDPGHYLKQFIHESVIFPFPSEGEDKFKQSIECLSRDKKIDIIIPCLDAELPLYLKNQDYLDELGITCFLPSSRQFNLRSKQYLNELASNFEVLHPQTETVCNLDQLSERIKSNFDFPLVIKGNYYQAYLVRNIGSAILKATSICADWGLPVLVQEFIEGEEINLVGLGDGKGALLGQVSIKKQAMTSLGKLWNGVTIHDKDLELLANNFVQKTQWNGPFELECIKNPNGLYLIEINPRFPSWVYFASAVGVNLPARLLQKYLTGECERHSHYSAGKYLVRYCDEVITDITEYAAKAMR
jgi:carbamoyl-phosphate synthase large subunit